MTSRWKQFARGWSGLSALTLPGLICGGLFCVLAAAYAFVAGLWHLLILFGSLLFYGPVLLESELFPEQFGRATFDLIGPLLFGAIGAVCLAIGRPGETLPRLGAQRVYVDDAEWRQQILSWLSRAALVVIHVPPAHNDSRHNRLIGPSARDETRVRMCEEPVIRSASTAAFMHV